MKSSKIRHLLKAMLLLAVSAAISCESIPDGEGDCSVTYELQLTQTRNVLGVDAFAGRVKSVSAYFFDQNGHLRLTKHESGNDLASGSYTLKIKDTELTPGTYDVIVWGGLQEGDAFSLTRAASPAAKSDLTCRLARTYEDGNALSQRELNDLYHGAGRITIPGHVYGTYRIEEKIDLTKNTNKLSVVLQHFTGKPLKKEDFKFEVTDRNGLMNFDNSLMPDELITYRHHTIQEAEVTLPDDDEMQSRANTSVSSVIADIDLARLVDLADNKQEARLIVRANKNDGSKDVEILNVNLINMLLLIKDRKYKTNQDFLDCQDDFSMIFLLDDAYGWYTDNGIWINSWHIIEQYKDL